MKNAENIVDRGGKKTQVLTAIRINRLVIKIIRKQLKFIGYINRSGLKKLVLCGKILVKRVRERQRVLT